MRCGTNDVSNAFVVQNSYENQGLVTGNTGMKDKRFVLRKKYIKVVWDLKKVTYLPY